MTVEDTDTGIGGGTPAVADATAETAATAEAAKAETDAAAATAKTEADAAAAAAAADEGKAAADAKAVADEPAKTALGDDAKPKGEGEEEKKPLTEEEQKVADAAKARADGAPETYEEFKLPDGMERDTAQEASFQEFAKGAQFTQEQAQAIVDFEIERQAGFVADQTSKWADTTANWLVEAKKDPEIGGAKYDESVEYANQAIQKFGSVGLVDDVFKALGLGNHPEMIRSWAKVGKALAEGGVTTGRAGGENSQLTLAQRIYPSAKS